MLYTIKLGKKAVFLFFLGFTYLTFRNFFPILKTIKQPERHLIMKQFQGFKIEVSDVKAGEVIGTITPEEFKQWCAAYGETSNFTQSLISNFNAYKERIGDPERVKMVLI